MRHDPDAVMLFAAGFGTRMGVLTKTRPKPLIEVVGKPLLDHALDLVQAAGIQRQVVNVHYLADQITDHLRGRDIAISDERDAILETGGGLRKALPLLGNGPVFTMNTDAVWRGPNPFDILRKAWRPEDMDALLLCIPHERFVGHLGEGDFAISPSGTLTRGGPMVYCGVQIIKTDRLAQIDEPAFSLNQMWNLMAQEERLFGTLYPGTLADVGRPESIALAEEMLKTHV